MRFLRKLYIEFRSVMGWNSEKSERSLILLEAKEAKEEEAKVID